MCVECVCGRGVVRRRRRRCRGAAPRSPRRARRAATPVSGSGPAGRAVPLRANIVPGCGAGGAGSGPGPGGGGGAGRGRVRPGRGGAPRPLPPPRPPPADCRAAGRGRNDTGAARRPLRRLGLLSWAGRRRAGGEVRAAALLLLPALRPPPASARAARRPQPARGDRAPSARRAAGCGGPWDRQVSAGPSRRRAVRVWRSPSALRRPGSAASECEAGCGWGPAVGR